ncbi:hypothetical protein KZZ52_08840 [Dactylosporangium sp. AC04546]|uniref:hypothetical protein n=1 Tax=Dactylosporangium sp. AC04546 TaxID=2862460 RepID=UPI001EDCD627|nr:hypothetical protein [Dactylosporangium sp. AC04546]WVK85474.1 hypothetical protein KZZ52_08840 [Dactylosporangium sp. AC04546]
MSSQWKKGRQRAESVAEDAWDYLRAAVDSASDTARSVGGTVRHRASDLADEASSRYGAASGRVGSAADEAWRRANLALDALSGRRPRKPWGWIAVAVLGGVAVGWAVAASAPRAISAAADRFAADEPDENPTGTTTVYDAPAGPGPI